jgi:hypothetical protein
VFSLLLVIVFLCIPPSLVYFAEITHYDVVSSLVQLLEEHPIHELTSAAKKDDVVHFHAHPKNFFVKDTAMEVKISNTLKLRRVTEYCQWQQLQSTSCQTCTREVKAKDGSNQTESYDCHCVTSYHYVKAWRSFRISSIMFDQPGAHSNPGRDPMPTSVFVAPEAEVISHHGSTKVLVDESILRNARGTFHRVEWNLHGVAPRSWWSRWRWWKDTTRYEDIHQLRDTYQSPAAINHNFVYVGDGYFFSPYQASRSQQLFKYLNEYIEGSLFDWQLGDIMPSCTAGDVRFYYEVMDPTTASVIGQVVENKPVVRLRAIQTDRRDVGMIHEGIHAVRDMFIAEERTSWWEAMLPRVLLIPWSAAMMNLCFAFLGRRVIGLDVLPGTASFWLGFMGIFWSKLWGKSNESVAYVTSAVVLFVWTLGRSGRRPGGLRAVWCMLGKWARVPPSWRVKDTYDDDEGEAYDKKDM